MQAAFNAVDGGRRSQRRLQPGECRFILLGAQGGVRTDPAPPGQPRPPRSSTFSSGVTRPLKLADPPQADSLAARKVTPHGTEFDEADTG